jgi:hypothetical protein
VTREPGEPLPPPPLLGSWRNVYTLVVGVLAVLIALFYALTRWAS